MKKLIYESLSEKILKIIRYKSVNSKINKWINKQT